MRVVLKISNDSHEFLSCIPLYHKNSSKINFHFLINWSFLKAACGCLYLMNIDHFGDDKIDDYSIWTCKDNICSSKFVFDNVYVRFGNEVFRYWNSSGYKLCFFHCWYCYSDIYPNVWLQSKKTILNDHWSVYSLLDDMVTVNNYNYLLNKLNNLS